MATSDEPSLRDEVNAATILSGWQVTVDKISDTQQHSEHDREEMCAVLKDLNEQINKLKADQIELAVVGSTAYEAFETRLKTLTSQINQSFDELETTIKTQQKSPTTAPLQNPQDVQIFQHFSSKDPLFGLSPLPMPNILQEQEIKKRKVELPSSPIQRLTPIVEPMSTSWRPALEFSPAKRYQDQVVQIRKEMERDGRYTFVYSADGQKEPATATTTTTLALEATLSTQRQSLLRLAQEEVLADLHKIKSAVDSANTHISTLTTASLCASNLISNTALSFNNFSLEYHAVLTKLQQLISQPLVNVPVIHEQVYFSFPKILPNFEVPANFETIGHVYRSRRDYNSVFKPQRTLGNLGGFDGAFDSPLGVTTKTTSNSNETILVVVDAGNKRIQLLTTTGESVSTIRMNSRPRHAVFNPHSNTFWVTAFDNGRMYVLASDGSVLHCIYEQQNCAVAVLRNGDVVVSCYSGVISKFSSTGTFVSRVNIPQLGYKTRGMISTPNDMLIICDCYHNCLQVVDGETLSFIRSISGLQEPLDVALSPDQHLVVAEAAGQISILTMEGKLIHRWSQLDRPGGVTVLPNCDIVVCDERKSVIFFF